MFPDISNSIILFGGGLAFLTGLSQLGRPNRAFHNIMLCIVFTGFSLLQIQHFFSSADGEHFFPGSHNFIFVNFILGPSMYLYYVSVFTEECHFIRKKLYHFIPAFLAASIDLIILFPAFFLKNTPETIYRIIFSRSLPDCLNIAGLCITLLYILRIFSKMKIAATIKNYAKEQLRVIAFSVTVILFIIMTLMIASVATKKITFIKAGLILTSFFVIYWFIINQIFPQLFLPDQSEKSQKRVSTLLQGLDCKKIEKKLNSLMEDEKVYCDEDLTLKRLSELLSIHPQQLSTYLNHKLEINFNNYINRYRIEESIKLMQTDTDRSLLSIAYAAGINSKSVFYDAFSKQKGMSPAQFRKSLIN